MRLELLILTGEDAGRRLVLGPAATVLGRSPQVTLPFPRDTFLSGAHVQLLAAADGSGVTVTDLRSTNGTSLNGARIDEAFAVPGDVLQVGSLALRLVPTVGPSLEGEPVLSVQAVDSSPVPEAGVEALVTNLTAGGMPLFAVVDAAADPAVFEHLQHPQREAVSAMQSLYEGAAGQELAPWAPYLLALSPDSPLLRTLLREGWGKAWASYCTAHVPFNELRRHLRRFLMVQMEDGPQVYFRFYDPRVLREFLPTANHAELLYFFGPVQEWLIEGADGETLLRSRCNQDGLITEALPGSSRGHYTTTKSA